MKKQKRIKAILIWVISIIISGCFPSARTLGVPQVVTDTHSSFELKHTVTPPPLHTPTITVETITVNKTIQTSTSSNPLTFTPTPPITSNPPLEPKDAQDKLTNLIKQRGTCLLPCFLGITPGISTVNDLEIAFTPYTAILSTWGGKEGLDFELGKEIKNHFYLEYRANPNQQIINRLYVSTQATRMIEYPYPDEEGNTYEFVYEYGAETYRQLMSNYSLQKLLTEYGIPSRLLVRAEQYLYDGRPPLPSQQFGQIKLRLFYPEHGIIIMFKMPLSKAGSNGQGCPSMAFVSFWLTPPDIDGSYAKMLSQKEQQGNAFELEKTPDESINMNLEQFYDTFQSSEDTCIQTPLSLWPSH